MQIRAAAMGYAEWGPAEELAELKDIFIADMELIRSIHEIP